MQEVINKWERIELGGEAERLYSKPRSFAEDVWFRFSHKPTALLGLIIIALLLVFAIAGPYFTPYGYDDQNTKLANIPPVMQVYPAPDGNFLYITKALKIIEVDKDGHLLGQLKKGKDNSKEKITVFPYKDDMTVTLDYTVMPATIRDADGNRIEKGKSIWNHTYLLGTDHLGRDILSRLMYGTRISLLVAFIAAAVNMVIGIFYGGISGYLGGRTDAIMMRIVDIIYSLPDMLIIILLSVVIKSTLGDDANQNILLKTFGANMVSIFIVFGLLYWVGMARLVRGQILTIKNNEYILAARAIGARPAHIIRKHIIPNCISVIIITTALQIPSAIFTESFLSFVGMGVEAPMPSLGSLANSAREGLQSYPGQLIYPAVLIVLIVLAFNLLGDGLRDAFDPKLRR